MAVDQNVLVTLDGRPCVVPDPARYPQVAQRANAYWCPLGPAVGRGWVLMLRRDLEPILSGGAAFHALSIRIDGASAAQVVFPALLIVQSQRISAGVAAAGEALYLVELADKRWLVERYSDTGGIAINLRSYAQNVDYLSGTSGHTWSSAIELLWGTMAGVLGSFPGLPPGLEPHGVPENLQFIGASSWKTLSSLLAKIGCAVAYDPVADVFRIENLGAAQAGLPTDLDSRPRLSDAEPLVPATPWFPAILRVYFHNHRKSFGQESDTELESNWRSSEHSFSIDIPSGVSNAAPGTVLALWDDLPRVLDQNNAPANFGDLIDRAIERTAQWVSQQSLSGGLRHQVFPGVSADVRPGSQLKAVLWRAWGPQAGGTATEAFTHPGLPRRFPGDPSSQQDDSLGPVAPGDENFAPPDLARHSYPNYPRVAQLVQVFQSLAIPYGRDIAPNPDGLIPGRVVRYVAGSIVTLENCWIRPITLEGGEAPNPADVISLRHGDRFVGRLCGIRTSQGATRPVYLVQYAAELCREFSARASNYLVISPTPQSLILDTVETDEGEVAEIRASGEILSHIVGGVQLRYKVVVDHTSTEGGPSHFECYVEQSDDNGNTWSEIPDSRTGQISHDSSGAVSSVAAPAIFSESVNGSLFRLVVINVTGPASCRTRSHQCHLFLEPCGAATTMSLTHDLFAFWIPGIIIGGDEPSLIQTEMFLVDHGDIDRGTGDEESHSWAFDGSDDYFSLSQRLINTDEDFTIRVHFKLNSNPPDSFALPIFWAHQSGGTPDQVDAYISLYKAPEDPFCEAVATVGRSAVAALARVPNTIGTGTWYTAYLRWRVSDLTADLEIVGQGSDSDTATGSRLSYPSPIVEIGGSPDWPGYLDVEIDSLRLWRRRLADHELT